MSTDKKRLGIYNKFTVRRNDGKDAPGEKHDGCEYFVLDLDHDPHAIPAILAYADSCEADGYVPLADSLRRRAKVRDSIFEKQSSLPDAPAAPTTANTDRLSIQTEGEE